YPSYSLYRSLTPHPRLPFLLLYHTATYQIYTLSLHDALPISKIPEIDLFESLGKNIHISFCLLFGSLYKYILLFSPIIFDNISLPCFQNYHTLFIWAEGKTSHDRAK